MVVTGDDEIGTGLNPAFQDAVIRKVLKNPDSGRRLDDRRNASDESEGGCNVFFPLLKLSSEDACGFGQNRNRGKERRLSSLDAEEGIFGEAPREKEGRDIDVGVEDYLHQRSSNTIRETSSSVKEPRRRTRRVILRCNAKNSSSARRSL